MFVMPLVTRPRDKIWLFWYWLIIYNTFSYWSIFYCLWDQTPGHILKLPITIFLSFKTIKRFLLSIFEFLVLDRTVTQWSAGQLHLLSDLVFLQMSSLRNLNISRTFYTPPPPPLPASCLSSNHLHGVFTPTGMITLIPGEYQVAQTSFDTI